jgi:phosphoglycolate phosphatase-like HAD superfamily hydrolase
MIGDKVEDILFGLSIGARPILVLTGYGKKSKDELENRRLNPSFIAPTLLDAVDWILKREGREDLITSP